MTSSNQRRKINKRNLDWKRRSKSLTVCRWRDPLHRKPYRLHQKITRAKTLILWGIGGRRKRTEVELAGWHHRLDGREFEWTPGVGDGQGVLSCCNSWGRKSRTRLSDWTELDWTKSMNIVKLQDIKSTHRNPLRFYTLTMRKQKEKLRKQFHSPLQGKE